MKIDTRTEYLTRDRILKMLSDDEIARVSTVEGSQRLVPGDEYLDLERLAEGVKRATGSALPTGNLLPKSAVRAGTWDDIVARLSASSAATPPAAHD
jgi:hypothetical protein